MADPAGVVSVTPEDTQSSPHSDSFWGLALGSIGVVFGDIGTSPLYALREALAHSKGAGEAVVMGVVSLVFWAATLGAVGALMAVPLSLLARALLVDADPRSAWIGSLLIGGEPKPQDEPQQEDELVAMA